MVAVYVQIIQVLVFLNRTQQEIAFLHFLVSYSPEVVFKRLSQSGFVRRGHDARLILRVTQGRWVHYIREHDRVPLREHFVVIPVEFEAEGEMACYLLGQTLELLLRVESVAELAEELVDPQAHELVPSLDHPRPHTQHPVEHCLKRLHREHVVRLPRRR